jgi:hypothetical protein
MHNTFNIQSAAGVPMLARLVMPGDGWGFWSSAEQTWDQVHHKDVPCMLEFYERSNPAAGSRGPSLFQTPYGEFTGGMFAMDTIERAAAASSAPFLVNAQRQDWNLTSETLSQVLSWAKQRIQLAESEATEKQGSAMEDHTLKFTAENGVQFSARLVRAGHGYGTWDRKTETWEFVQPEGAEPLLEFYDLRDPSRFDTPHGQLISGHQVARFYLSALEQDLQRGPWTFPAEPAAAHILLTGRHNDRTVDRESMRKVVDWAFERISPSEKRVTLMAPALRDAERNMEGFEYRQVVSSDQETAEIWRAERPGSSDMAFDIVVTRYGISVFGDMGALVFNVGAQYGIKFLAGDDVRGYIHGKLDDMCKKEELDPRRAVQLVAQGVVDYLDAVWYGPAKAGVPDGGIHQAAEALRKSLGTDPAGALENFMTACQGHEEAGWEGFHAGFQPGDVAQRIQNLLIDVRNEKDPQEVRRILDDCSSEFYGVFDDLSGCQLTAPAQSLMTKLYMVNLAAKQIMAGKQVELHKSFSRMTGQATVEDGPRDRPRG